MENAGGFLVIAFLLLIYFIPSIIVWGKRQSDSVIALNLLLGWTILGWIVALVWALNNTPTPVVKVINNPPSPNPASTSKTSIADELAKLRDLRDQGILTPEEFERQKNNLLS
jgi:Superinfection immunity protein/Short C-terminal domain